MKTLCVLLSFRPPVVPGRPLAGRTVERWVSDALNQAIPGVPTKSLGPFADSADFISSLISVADGCDELILVRSDGPFLRPDLITQTLGLHRQYRADYSFADGYPVGLTPEILRPSALPLLKTWAEGRLGPVDGDTLFQLLSVDINRFDVETLLSPVDLRSRRLSFCADSLRGWLLLDRYVDDVTLDTKAFLELLEATAERSRTLPATLMVQVTDATLQTPVWSPLSLAGSPPPGPRSFLSRAQWNDLLDRALSWAGDLTVLPAFWGEPALHPEILSLVTDALAKPGLKLCLETSGLGWTGIDLESLAATHPTNLDWIVELDSDNPETYQLLRGEGFAEAQAFATRIVDLFPGHVWPQTVRMTQNEGEMESFYQHWKEAAGRVIIQKHNDFGGRLPRAKPSDLSPWKRHPCWHLARDLAVFLDGTAVVCRDDWDRTQPLGNVWVEDLALVWSRGDRLFRGHTRGDWSGVCRNCDEWYTFFF